MKTKKFAMRSLLTVCMLLLFSMAAFAQTKTVTPTPTPQTLGPSANFSFDVNYNSTDNTTTGIGFRTCFNSAEVTYVNETNVLATGFQGSSLAADAADADADATTDFCVTYLWLDLGGSWPNVALPTRLFTGNYTTTAGFVSPDTTTINLVNSSCGAGFTCTYFDVVINSPVPPTVTLSPDPLSVAAGTTAPMTATISAAQGTNTVVTLASNTANATVPANVTILAGQTSAIFNVTGVTAGGSAVITATLPAGLGGDTDTATVNVTAATITLNCPASVSVGGTVPCTVQVTPGQVTNVTIADGPNTTAAPLTVTTTAGGAGTFNLTGNTVGGPDTITATLPAGLGGASATDTVTVQAVSLIVTPASVATTVVGASTSVTACFDVAQPAATVTFTGAGNFTITPAAPTIAASAICPAGATFTIRPNVVSAAAQTITVTAGGLSDTIVFTAVTAITCTLADAGSGVTLTLSQSQPVAMTVGVTSSDTAVLTVPATFNVPANTTSVSIPYTVLSAGTSTVVTTLPATVGGGTCSVAAVVNPTPIPAVGGLGLALLAGLLALAGAFFVRK